MSRRSLDWIDVVDALYEGMLDEVAWRGALLKLTDLIGGSAGTLFSLNPSTGEVYRADVVRCDERVMHDYSAYWIHHDARHAAGLSCPVGQPQVDGMLVPTRDFHRSAVFRDFLNPSDIPFHVATWIERQPTRGVVLSIQGSRRRGVFSAHDAKQIGALVPHLRRIVQVKDRLARANGTSEGLLHAIDRFPFGMLLLAADLQILEASASARAMLARRAGIHADGGTLGFCSADDERAFARRVHEDSAAAREDDAIYVRRQGQPPLSILPLPLQPAQEQWLVPTARWLVLLLEPSSPHVRSETVLMRTLGITRAEAAVARLVADGLSPAEAAAKLEVSTNTVRSQLKSVYSKTGVNGQAQLVRLVLTTPDLSKKGRHGV